MKDKVEMKEAEAIAYRRKLHEKGDYNLQFVRNLPKQPAETRKLEDQKDYINRILKDRNTERGTYDEYMRKFYVKKGFSKDKSLEKNAEDPLEEFNHLTKGFKVGSSSDETRFLKSNLKVLDKKIQDKSLRLKYRLDPLKGKKNEDYIDSCYIGSITAKLNLLERYFDDDTRENYSQPNLLPNNQCYTQKLSNKGNKSALSDKKLDMHSSRIKN